MFYYKFNLSLPKLNWYGSKACRFKDLINISELRNIKPKNTIGGELILFLKKINL